MAYLVVAILGVLTAYIVATVFDWDQLSEHAGPMVYDTEGKPLYREYEVKVYGRSYSARRMIVETPVHDVCPYCGGRVVPYEEDMWMGGHFTFCTMYGCDGCDHTSEEDFGTSGTRSVESPDLEYLVPEPVPRDCPTKLFMGLFVVMTVLGCGSFVASILLPLGSYWRIVGIGSFLCGVSGAACLANYEKAD